ncbi:MAG: TolC family protein [Desulfobacteraceae bacterium]|jgi:outer membrane protein TolC
MKPILLFIISFVLASSGSAWCSDRYDYDRIKGDYPAYYCPVSADTSSKEKAFCILDKTLSLKLALDMALKNNPDTQVAEARIRQSEAMLKRANAAFMPVVNVYTEYTRGDFPSGYLFKTIDQRLFENGTNFNDPGIIENFETGISAQLSLFDGGRHMIGRNMAREDLSMSTSDRLATRNSVAAQLINAWYDNLSASEYVKIAEESVVSVKSQLDIMTVRFKGGSALRSDILSLNVRLAQAEEEVLKSKNRHKLAGAALATILGFPPDRDVTIDPAPFSLAQIPDSYEKGMEQAMVKRPELTKIKSMVKKSRMAMDMSKSAYLPTAGLMGKYYVDDPSMDYETDRDNWAIGVMVNWNIFSGFSDKAGTASADAGLREALSSDRKTLLAISFDVKNAFLRRDEATARMDVSRRSILMAEENLALVKKQYEGGSATITRYLEAELDRNTAKIRATSAFYDHEKAVADIARSIGILSEPEQIIAHAPEEKNEEKINEK